MNEPFPKLLIVNRLVQPLNAANDILGRFVTDLTVEHSPTLLQGALVMAVAAMEVALADSLKYYLRNFPEKVPDHARTSVESVPTDMADFVTSLAERYTATLAYKSFPKFVSQYEKILSIEIAGALSEAMEVVQEVKATRNLLLHKGLVVSDFYLEQAGNRRRAHEIGGRLEVNKAYVTDSISALSGFIDGLVAALSAKYASYTKIAAHRKLWNYIFASPVMPYDEFWAVDEVANHIFALKKGSHEDQLSSTELLFLGLWRAHFNGDGRYLTTLDMRRLDRSHLRKFHFLLSIARTFPWE